MNDLQRVQRTIDENDRLTLAPDRDRATSLEELVETVASPDERTALSDALVRIVSAQARAFPENIFWDFDYFASEICAAARQAVSFDAHLNDVASAMTRLMGLYGVESPIRFRYVHDFVYGFDWARWVRKEPDQRAASTPFGRVYLGYSRTRAYELLAMIAKNHERYPTIAPNERRNPFSFSREPEPEMRLYQDLAKHDALPIRAWDRHTTPCWDAPHDDFRRTRAVELGLKRSA